MKRYRYVVAATCLMLSAAGFIGLYATNQTKEEEQAKNQNIIEESEDIILGSNLFDTEYEEEEFWEEPDQVAGIDEDVNIEDGQEENLELKVTQILQLLILLSGQVTGNYLLLEQ